jgi:uncharacterized damage-inducible protein DinB
MIPRMEPSRIFLDKSRSLLAGEYLPHIERCFESLTDEDIWWRPNERSNSIGNLILHLSGNLTQWILGGVGKQPYERQRQQEFDERGPVPKQDLLLRIRAVVKAADEVIAEMTPTELTSARRIQGYDVTVLEAIYHVVEHFSMHTGQIILMTKARTGKDLGLWKAPVARN